ncbi:MAG: DUF169 domain-containing protein [Syntrophomonadaceae bacterium]
MESKLVEALKVKMQPIAVLLTDTKPAGGVQFKAGARRGCVGTMMLAAARGRTAIFDRQTYGCPGGGVGLGFGDCYGRFPIHCLLSTGSPEAAAALGRAPDSEMAAGERFFQTPDLARQWVEAMPFTDVPARYVVFKPLAQVDEADQPRLVVFFVNPDQLSALVVMAGYNRGSGESVTVPFGAACQSILYGYAEALRERPRAVVGFFDISQRHHVERDILSLTIPYKMFLEMEDNVAGSFLEAPAWNKLQERQ